MLANVLSISLSLWDLCLALLFLVVAYPASIAIFNLYFHPLSKYPGPKLWAAFRLTYVRAIWRGTHVYDVFAMHQKYGHIVRVAPDEISVASIDGWHDIYCYRYNHRRFPKNPLWWSELPGRVPSITSTDNEADHTRIRRLISYCMTPRAVHAHEPIVQHYADLLIRQLRERGAQDSATKSTVVNIVDWMMYVVFDIIGDLGFGESFHCLEHSAFHAWIAEIFSYFEAGALVVTLRYYSALYQLFMWCLPKKTLNAAQQNYQYGVEKIHRRLNLETEREDFMRRILLRNNEEQNKGMSLPEIESTMNVVIVAGSETCGTVLSGTINYLTKTSSALRELAAEIRTAFSDSEDMTFAKLKDLPYLNAVVEEGLRMCPPNPGGLHHVVPPGGDYICGHWFPEGTDVSVHQYSLTRSPANFHRPDDFCPERWLPDALSDPSSTFHNDKREASQAFSVGAWSCIGKYLAYQELRLILAKLVWHFDIAMAEGGRNVEWTKQKCFALVKKEPFDVKLVDVRE